MATPVVDIHAHYFPESYLKIAADQGSRFGATLTEDPRGRVLRVGLMRAGPITPAYTDLDLRLKAMDAQGVTVQALSLTQPMVYWAQGEVGLRLAAAFNDAASAAHMAHPGRFVAFACLPLHEPALAAQELERAAKLPGMRGVYLGTTIGERELSDKAFFPVYERIEHLNLPIFLHPTQVIAHQRLQPFYLNNLLGNPFDTAVAASHLMFGGVLDAFPRLKVCLPHAGGALLGLIGRLDHGHTVRPECKHLPHPPSHYLRRFLYDTIAHSDQLLLAMIDTVGHDRVALGSDYCFDMGYERPVERVTRLKGLSQDQRTAILGGNV
ncbi:MAG TPA: amidohydrolase family protein, partial [bacterium]|nr:amidohydrolase family protein [bacterium]